MQHIEMNSVETLAEAGRLLHGAEWQGPLARDVAINRETIRRWLNGRTPLPPDHSVFERLAAVLAAAADREIQHAASMRQLAARMIAGHD